MELSVVEDIKLETPRPKLFMDILGKLKVADKKIMYVLPEYNDNVDLCHFGTFLPFWEYY